MTHPFVVGPSLPQVAFGATDKEFCRDYVALVAVAVSKILFWGPGTRT